MTFFVHDFAVTAAVIFWTVIAGVGFPDIAIPELQGPDKFAPTFACCDAACTKFWPDNCECQAEPFGTRNEVPYVK